MNFRVMGLFSVTAATAIAAIAFAASEGFDEQARARRQGAGLVA